MLSAPGRLIYALIAPNYDPATALETRKNINMNLLNTLGGSTAGRGKVSPALLAVLGVLAYRTLKGKGRLADLLGTANPGAQKASPLSAGLGGGALLGGLTELLERFRPGTPKTAAQSWVSAGPNLPITAGELAQALGEERVEWLTAQTGLSKDELLAGLATALPDAIDKLTPSGRLPTETELDALGSAEDQTKTG